MMVPARSRLRRGVTLSECACWLASLGVLVALVMPSVRAVRAGADVDGSIANLMTLGATHALYAADWNDRQPTFVADELSAYGGAPPGALSAWCAVNGEHPPMTVGWGLHENDPFEPPFLFRYRLECGAQLGNASLIQPIVFTQATGIRYFGSFRFINARPLHGYLGGRMYEEVFYAPADQIAWDLAGSAFDWPLEYWDRPPTPQGDLPAFASYCWSAAGMFHPDVLRNPIAGGYQDPWSIDHGFTSPSFAQVLHPSLKTLLLEHNWLQNAPADPCNPASRTGSYPFCQPWQFNHGIDSAPAALFHDLSIALLPNALVQAEDELLHAQTGYGLWSRGTPFGADGYLIDLGDQTCEVSHHVLTTDGVLGRDRLESSGVAPMARRRMPSPDAQREARPRGASPDALDVRLRLSNRD